MLHSLCLVVGVFVLVFVFVFVLLKKNILCSFKTQACIGIFILFFLPFFLVAGPLVEPKIVGYSLLTYVRALLQSL